MTKARLPLFLLFSAIIPVHAEAPPILSFGLDVNAVIGTSTADEPARFAPGGHDPNRKEAFILQSFEPSVSLRWGDYIRGFASGSLHTDDHDDFEWEWEEHFLALHNLPGGIELRGGRFLNRVGLHNANHLHAWETVDAPLPHALFLGEDGLQTLGAEFNLHLDTRSPSVLTLSFGKRPHHGHGHSHGHHDDHDGHDDHGHGDHGELEEFQLDEDFVTLGYRSLIRLNDFQSWTLAVAGGMGTNEEGGDSWFALAGAEYNWRENGFEPGGRELSWRTEAIRFLGKIGHGHGHHDHDDDHQDDAHHDDLEDEHAETASGWGVSTQLAYQATARLRPFGRIDHVSSIPGLDLESWTRYSAGVTVAVLDQPNTYLRLQANFDELGHDSEQSVWLQFGMSFGGPEVR